MPAGMKDQMQAQIPKGVEACLTPKEAAEEDFATKMSQVGQKNNCEFNKKSVAGRKLNLAGTCKTPQGNVRMTMTGDLSPKSTVADLTMNGVSGQTNGLVLVMKVTTTHTGPCKAQ
jgi:hypothetical protein